MISSNQATASAKQWQCLYLPAAKSSDVWLDGICCCCCWERTKLPCSRRFWLSTPARSCTAHRLRMCRSSAPPTWDP